MADDRLLDEDEVMQICFVTNDLDASLAWFAKLTGKEPVHVSDVTPPDPETSTFKGEPAGFSFRLGLFRFGNLDFEFLEPGPEPSTWREELDAKGPGFHHFAFRTRDMARRRQHLEESGVPLIQHGNFPSKDGQYEYFHAPQMGSIIELLQWDKDRVSA